MDVAAFVVLLEHFPRLLAVLQSRTSASPQGASVVIRKRDPSFSVFSLAGTEHGELYGLDF